MPTRVVVPQTYDVVGLGVATLDFIGVADGEPCLGMKQPLAHWIEAGGGPVATALVTLARLGMRVYMAGAVGDDMYGQRIITELDQEGVCVDGFQVRPGSSHIAFALAEPGLGRRTIWWHNDPSVFEGVTLNREIITSARLLHLDSHIPEVGLTAARWMQEADGLVMIDAERFKESTLALLPYCDLMIVSERFGREISGETEPAEAARFLYARYGGVAIVTAGERGSWCVGPDETFHTPAFAVEVRDTTGAGDVFHGGFIYGLLQGWSLRETARFASATAALKCRAFGGRAGIPGLEEINALLAS